MCVSAGGGGGAGGRAPPRPPHTPAVVEPVCLSPFPPPPPATHTHPHTPSCLYPENHAMLRPMKTSMDR
ncbi:MAG: hypothetical protein LBK99_10680, partial [Opitutaceae bacterium]|nr:hypothetical protein [Opitutaceae bacterium]